MNPGSLFRIAVIGFLSFLHAPTSHADPLPWVDATIADISVSADLATGRAEDSFSMQFTTPAGQLLIVQLRPHDAFNQSVADHLGNATRIHARTYLGKLVGVEDSWARMTRIGSRWIGAVDDGQTTWFLEPAGQHPAWASRHGVERDETLVFSLPAQQEGAGFLDDIRFAPPQPVSGLRTATGAATGGLRLRLSLVLDVPFQQHYGSDAESVAVAMVAIMDGIYVDQLNMQVRLDQLTLLSADDPVSGTNMSDLFNSFVNWARGLDMSSRGVRHLLSGRQLEGGTAGVAYLGAACKTDWALGANMAWYGAAISVNILAHEVGHNLGLHHDPTYQEYPACAAADFIMSRYASTHTERRRFSQCSKDDFATFLANNDHSCLIMNAIFEDGFEPASP